MKHFLRTAFLAILALCAFTAAVPTAHAAGEQPATVRLTSNGDLLVRAQSDDLFIQVNSNSAATGAYAVWVTDNTGQLHVHNVAGVTRDVRVEYQSYGDVRVEFGKLTPTVVSVDLRISGNHPPDARTWFSAFGLVVGDDLIVKGDVAFAMTDSTVGDDLLAHPAHGPADIDLDNVSINDRLYVRGSTTSLLSFSMVQVDAGSLSIFGSPFDDFVGVTQSTLGDSPAFRLREGNDSLQLDDLQWSQTLKFRGAEGNDSLRIYGDLFGAYDVQMQDGDDLLWMSQELSDLVSGSLFHGGNGTDHVDDSGDRLAEVDVKKFELFD